jgi:hypothetical protein
MDMNRRIADGFFGGAAAAVVAQLAGLGPFKPGVGKAEVEAVGGEPEYDATAAAGVIAGSTGIARLPTALPIAPAGAGVEADGSTAAAGRAA